MHKIENIYFLILMVFFINSCETEEENRNPQFFASIHIHIPPDLADEKELITFIESSEKAINEYSDHIEEFAFEGMSILEMNKDKMSNADKNKLGLMHIQFVSNSTRMLNVLEDTEKFIEKEKKNGLDESHLRTLKTIKDVFEKRIVDINKRYKKYFI